MKIINPKEKARLAERMRELAKYASDSEEHRKARQALAIQYSKLDAEWARRCRGAARQGRITFPFDGKMIDYYPQTGEFRYLTHDNKDRVGKSPVKVRSNGQHCITTKEGIPHTAARLAYIAVHGDVPPNTEVYCVDGDPSNLVITNLRAYTGRKRIEEDDPSFREFAREALRKIREEKEASS